MNKLNKKGFTLIEMLVVIAIIAILVAIIIPTIGSATDKAAAATNAANLRSYKAELTTALLTGTIAKPGDTEAPNLNGTGIVAPKAKAVGAAVEGTLAAAAYDKNTNSFTVTFNGKNIEYFADLASH